MSRPLPSLVLRPHFVLRSPLLELDVLADWPRDLAGARARLGELLERPEVLEAIAIAAPSVAEGIGLWRKEPTSERGQRLERALMSYLQRLASRPTPFGLFAGVTLGTLGRSTALELEPGTSGRRLTRVDMGVLFQLSERLLKAPAVRGRVRFRPNETLVRVGEHVHFVQGFQSGEERVYELSQSSAPEALLSLLDFAAGGKSVPELLAHVQTLVADAAPEELSGFLDQVIDEQLLLPDLRPLLTGREAFAELLEQLEGLTLPDDTAAALVAVKTSLAALDASAPGQGLQRHLDATAAVQALKVKAEPGRALQVDLYKPAVRAELSTGLVQGVQRVLERLTAVFPPAESQLSAFKEAFSRRWESAEVPLLEALDEEVGLGFLSAAFGDSPLLKDLPLGAAPGTPPRTARPELDAWLSEVFLRAQLSGRAAVELEDQELERLGTPRPALESFAVMLSLFEPTEVTAPLGEVSMSSGPPSEYLNARFCWLDPKLHQSSAEALLAEEALRPECVFADLVHSPEGRVGNVIARPGLRRFELPLLARSGAPAERQLALSDLTLSLAGARLVLRSRSLGKEVVVRLTNAHNTARGLPLYRFLAALGRDEQLPSPVWSWGHLASAPVLPRVTFKRWVVSPARWVLSRRAIEKVHGPAELAALGARLGWPRFLLAQDFDNRLPVDLENPLSVQTFLDTYRARPEVMLREDLQRHYSSCVRTARGRLANEVVLSLGTAERVVEAARPPVKEPLVRRFTPGDEWLYVRLTAAVASADELLLTVVGPLVDRLRAQGGLSRWFFIRYQDPDHHLRLRFRGDPRFLGEQVLPQLHQALASARASGQVAREELGTYVREVERYGGARGVEAAEAIFEADSDAVLKLLALSPSRAGLDLRWRWALPAIADLFAALELSPAERVLALQGWRGSLFEEFGGADALEEALSKKGRALRAEVDGLLGKTVTTTPLADAWPVLKARAQALHSLAAPLREGAKAATLSAPLSEVAGALVHMTCNRLLRSAQRANELVLYDVLLRHLQSGLARSGARPEKGRAR